MTDGPQPVAAAGASAPPRMPGVGIRWMGSAGDVPRKAFLAGQAKEELTQALAAAGFADARVVDDMGEGDFCALAVKA